MQTIESHLLDNIGMVETLQLFEHGNLSQQRDGHTVAANVDTNLFQRYHSIVDQVSSLEDRAIGPRADESNLFIVIGVLDYKNNNI